MHATRTLHPPGGATALIAVIGSERIHELGWLYVLVPATLGPLILLLVAVVAWFYRTFADCKDQGRLVRIGE